MSTDDLLDRLRKGDEQAYDAIFRQYYATLVGFAERMLRDRGRAEDVVQDVMLEIWRRRESMESDGPLHTYLFRATRNRALNVVRHDRVERRAEPLIGDPDASAAPTDLAAESEIGQAMRQAIADLPPRCREIFELSRGHGLSYADIARTLGISTKTVETQMGRALKSLRVALADWLPTSETTDDQL